MSKKQSTRQTTNKLQLQQTIAQIHGLYDSLFTIRLAQRLSRPITNSQRMQILQEYKHKFNDLHQRLDQMRRLITTPAYIQDNTGYRNEDRSGKMYKAVDFKKQLNKIESRYIQLFRDGSFKHYGKIAKLYQLPENIQLINIEDWCAEIMQSSGERSRCCC